MLLTFALLLIGSTSALAEKPLDDARDNPNILFIMVDDLGKEWISSYGAEGITTPNIDKLAADGMRFENAWCMPQCTPTRVTLLTGQYPYRHGWTNHWDVPRWGAGAHFDPTMNPSFPRQLREAGYKTAAAGKWQIDDLRVEPEAMDEAGFDRWCMWTGYETGVKASAERYWNPYIAMDGQSKTHAGKFGPDLYCDFLVDFIKANKDAPMFLYFPMCLTHGPFTSTPDEPDVKGRDSFPAMVRYTDKLVGRLVVALQEAGIRDKTYIVFTTDNGTGMGMKNKRNGTMVAASKMKMVEAGTAVPFIVTGPGIKPGSTTDALIDFSDLAPTFTALAGTAMPEKYVIDGKSFAPLLQGKADDSTRDWIVSMGGSPAKLRDGRVVPKDPYDERVLRDKRYKLWVDGRSEITKLFDMQEDPWEETNLLEVAEVEPEHVEAIAKFKAALATFPDTDAAPTYKKNSPQPWDRKN